MNDPGENARTDLGGTGMLCSLNDDQTTRKQLDAIRFSRLERRLTLHWNAIAWPIPTNLGASQLAPAAVALLHLLDHLEQLCGVIALGAIAKRVWEKASRRDRRLQSLAYLHNPHPERSRTTDLRNAYRRATEIAASG